jgi:hypothetical protein
MKAWIETDSIGSTVLLRSGRGVITAMSECAIGSIWRIEINCENPDQLVRSIRLSVRGEMNEENPFFIAAQDAYSRGSTIEWLIEWKRNEGIPPRIPIDALHLASDATAQVLSIAEIGLDTNSIASSQTDLGGRTSQ